MGFMDSLKKKVQKVEVEVSAERFAEVWDKIAPYNPEVHLNPRSKAVDYVKDVRVVEEEVGIFRKSKEKRVKVDVYRDYYGDEDYEDSWSDYETVVLRPNETVKLRFSRENYERLLKELGDVFGGK